MQCLGQELVDIPVTGDWESAGSLYENEELIVEVDYKLSLLACDSKSEFGNSNHLYRFRITSKKPTKQIEDKFLSFILIFQDCQGVVICKTANVNIGIRRKNDVWDGVQPLADPNGDNSFVGKKLLVPFGEVRISKQKNSTKDGECYAKVSHLLEKKKSEEKPAPPKEPEKEEVENPMISDSQFFPEIKIIKDAKMRIEPDVFSSAVGTLTASKKVALIGQEDAFWKIKFKDREGYILIADQNIDEKDARAKLQAALAKEQAELKKLAESQNQVVEEANPPTQPEPAKPVAQATPAKPIEKPAPLVLKVDEVILLKDVGFKATLIQTKKPTIIPKDQVIKVTGYDSKHWQILYQGKLGFIVDDAQIFAEKRSVLSYKEKYEAKLKQVVAEQVKPALTPSTLPNSVVLEREAKLRKTPDYGSATKSIAAFETIRVDGFSNHFWKVFYKGEEGYLADDMMYFKETDYLLTLKSNPQIIVLDREAKLRKVPEYGSDSKSIASFETIQVEGFINRHWKVNYKGEVGYLADDMLYFKETEYLLTLKANPLKPVAKQQEVEADSDVPIYPGGLDELNTNIISKMEYDFNSRKGKVLRVLYEVTINEKGMIESITTENSISLAMDEVVANAVKLIKPFKPARKNGVPIKSKLKFTLELK